MPLSRLLPLLALCLLSSLANAAGFNFIEVPADQDGPTLQGVIWSPCDAPPDKIALQPLVIDGVRGCPISGTRLPLVVMSHGTGGSSLGHHDTAATLADAGFVVAAINHPGDNFQDLSRQNQLSTFITRPADMKRLIDYMLGSWSGRAVVNSDAVGMFGFSRGGYTGLVAIGAVPNWTQRKDLCPSASVSPLCEQIGRRDLPQVPARDPRIKAAVIVDPLSFFDSGGLQSVTVPVQLWASALGGNGVTLDSVKAVRLGLPKPPSWHVAAGAAHFAFLAPCSAALEKLAPVICRDNPGFDRVAFHAAFNASVSEFFKQHLGR